MTREIAIPQQVIQEYPNDYILAFDSRSMVSKFPHRNPVLRRHVLEKFCEYLKKEGHSKTVSMQIAHSLGEMHLDSINQRRKELDPYRKMNMRVSEASRAADFMGYASDVVKRLNRKHQTSISPREAATWVDAHNEILNVLPPSAHRLIPEDRFLDACVGLRKERGKRLRPMDIKRAIELAAPKHDGRLDLAILQVHQMKLGAPRPELLEVVNFYDRYLRAKKEQQLNHPQEQQRVLLELLNRQMGKSRSARDESTALYRADIKRLIRAMSSGEFPASLKIEARKKIPGFDALPQERKDRILHSMQIRDLARMTPHIFELYYRSAAREGKYQAAFQWIVRCLESPSNRQALANQLMEWYGPKKKRNK